MKRYGNLSGNSGVIAYELGPESIVVQFQDRQKYRYTTARAGPAAIAAMKSLALAGQGLSTFIARHQPAYEEKLD